MVDDNEEKKRSYLWLAPCRWEPGVASDGPSCSSGRQPLEAESCLEPPLSILFGMGSCTLRRRTFSVWHSDKTILYQRWIIKFSLEGPKQSGARITQLSLTTQLWLLDIGIYLYRKTKEEIIDGYTYPFKTINYHKFVTTLLIYQILNLTV